MMKTVTMDELSAEKSEKHCSDLDSQYQNVLETYLPFIQEMQEKSAGTFIEMKWKLMRESLVNPKKALTLEMLETVRKMLDDLKTKEESSKNEESRASETEEQESPSPAKEAQPKPKADKIVTSPRSNASSDHSYAKLSANGAEEDASTAASSQSSSQSSLVGISSNNEESESNEEEKSSEEKLKQDINVKKLTAHDLFRDYEPVDDFNFDVSDSEYPELEQDEENERESSENSTQDETITVQQKPDAEKKVKEKIPEDKKKVLKEEEELKEKQNEENSADSTDMELDEELMAMNRTIINEEKAPESTDLDAKTISTEENSQLSSQSSSETGKSEFVSQTASEPSEAASEPSEEASQSVQAASQTSSDIDSASSSSACAKSTKKRRKNCRFTIEMIKEVIKLKEQMISEKAKLLDAILEKEKRRVAKRKEAKKLEASKSEDSEENLMEEVKKRPSTKIKLPSAKKPRVELKEIVIKQEKEDFEGFKGFDRSEVEDLNDITIIPYQCGVLSPPTVVRKTREVAEAPEIRSTLEIRPPEVRAPPKWKQSNIANMSFVKLKRGFMVKCNVDGCRFQSLIKETLKDHLEKKHSDKDWTGFCNICEQNVRLRKGSVLDEFAHMEFHMESPEKAENDDRFNDFPAFSKNSSVFPAPSKNLSVFPAFTKTSSVFLSPNSLPDSSSIAPAKSALEMYLTAEAPAPVARKPPKAQSPKKIKKLGRPRKVISPPKKAPIKPPALVYTPPPDVYTPAPATESDDSTSILSKLLSSSSFQPNIGGKLIKPPDCLRPWLKSESLKNSEQAKAMLNSKEALAATYKCMSTTCSFFTIDRELFLKHLSLHEKFTVSDKQNFLACSYCKFVAKKPASLADHVDNEHCHDQFQCNYCFYRACTVFSVTTHQSLFHQFQPSIILECDLIKPRDTRAHLEKVAQLRAEYVPPMICVFCRGIFFVMQAFKEHLFRHSDEPIQHAQCVKCGKKATNLQVRGHLEGCHGIGTFQCVYCSFGTESFDKLNNHIVNKHASKIPVYCERVWNENPDGTHKHISPSTVEATCIKNIKPNFQNHCKKELRKAPKDRVLLRNEENVGMLKPNLIVHKTSVRKSSEALNNPKSLLEVLKSELKNFKPSKQTHENPGRFSCQIVAQMPRDARTSSQEISSLLKPLPFKDM